ncbi:AraC family transcriptional regulator ligand-binding domain-containing protein [Alloalcanivorax sp. C16-2]|uniref:AraC family transcriptional regulator ligand-binding domain-containing protein n=1 Tax=Alloalcanivorax sp. C16-2 TaxID=3390052 RepID=UPI00397062F1
MEHHDASPRTDGRASLAPNRTMRRLVMEGLGRLGHDGARLAYETLPGGHPAYCDPHLEAPLFWSGIAERSGDDCIGLHIAEAVRPRLLDDILLIMYASDSFEDALAHFLRFQRLLSGGFQAALERRGETSRLIYDINYPGFGPLRQQAECLAVLLTKLFALFTDDAFRPTAVTFRHGCPGRTPEYRRLLGLDPAFGRPHDSLGFASSLLERRSLNANPGLVARLLPPLEDDLENLDDQQFLLRLQHWVEAHLGSDELRLSRCARAFGLKQIDLRRWLAERGTDFPTLCDEARERRARTPGQT